MRSEIRQNNGSESELPTDAGLRTEKYSQQKNYGTGSQQPRQMSEEFGNQENYLSHGVSDVSVGISACTVVCVAAGFLGGGRLAGGKSRAGERHTG